MNDHVRNMQERISRDHKNGLISFIFECPVFTDDHA